MALRAGNQKLLVDKLHAHKSRRNSIRHNPLRPRQPADLDSIDALQLTVGIEKSYGIAITDPAVAREAFHSVNTLQQWLSRQPNPIPSAPSA